MARRRSLAGSLAAPLSGSLAGARAGGGSAPFVGVIDAMIAAGGTAPNFMACISHRLYSAYTGALCRVREAGGGTQADIPYDASTNRLDEAALAAHCNGSNGFIVTLYDQSGNANDVTQATTSAQVKIYDGATTSVVVDGTLPFPVFGGTLGYARGDSAGITGSTAVTLAIFGAVSSAPEGYFANYRMAVGASANNQTFAIAAYQTTALPLTLVSSTGYRVFTPATSVADPHLILSQLAAGAGVGTSVCEQDGTALAESSVSSGIQATTLGASALSVGRWIGGNVGAHGGACAWLADNILLSGAPLAAFESFCAELEALTV